jgi:chromosome segregation ATPase
MAEMSAEMGGESTEVKSNDVAHEEAVTTPESTESESAEQNESDADTEENTPERQAKKLKNALDRQKKLARERLRKNNELTYQLEEMKRQLEKVSGVPDAKEVNQDDYETYSDYIEAKAIAAAEKKMAGGDAEAQKQLIEQQMKQVEAQRQQQLAEIVRETADIFPDFAQVITSQQSQLDALPERLQGVMFALENPAAVAYQLGKEGMIDVLGKMNQDAAVNYILEAQGRARQAMQGQSQQVGGDVVQPVQSPSVKVSNAPTPMRSAKGAAPTGKSLDALSPDELQKRMNNLAKGY